jgi:phospholipid-binding lipoprotein MlaA
MTLFNIHKLKNRALLLLSVVFLTACSQSNNTLTTSSSIKHIDPYEKTNRRIFRFNSSLDKYLVKPAAKVYKVITPEVVDNSVTNFFNNLEDVGSAINNLLQFKPRPAFVDSERVLFNSTVGLGGLFDAASALGFERYEEDFGQTLAHWGAGSGPYVMLPFFGPSTVRDATAKFTVDSLTNPIRYHNESLAFSALELLDKRADLFSDEDAFKNMSEDQYSALRDLWLQRRANEIRDGKKDPKQQSDLIDQLESLEDE